MGEKTKKAEVKGKVRKAKERKLKKKVAERKVKEKIAAARRKAAKIKGIKLREKRAKSKEKRFKRKFKEKKTKARMKRYPKKTSRGWKASFWTRTGNCRTVAQCSGKTKKRRADKVMTVAQINYRSTGGNWRGLNRAYQNNYFARFTGWVNVPRKGTYKFRTVSDDGSMLWVNNKRVVNNDRPHGMRSRSGTIKLDAGKYPVRVEFFENGGGAGLKVYWSGPRMRQRLLTASNVVSKKVSQFRRINKSRRRSRRKKHIRAAGW